MVNWASFSPDFSIKPSNSVNNFKNGSTNFSNTNLISKNNSSERNNGRHF